MIEQLSPDQILPTDAGNSMLVGRVWSQSRGGPCPVLVRGRQVLDLSGGRNTA